MYDLTASLGETRLRVRAHSLREYTLNKAVRMNTVAEAYAAPNGARPRRRITWMIAIGMIILSILAAALWRTANNYGNYRRMGDAVLNYEQR